MKRLEAAENRRASRTDSGHGCEESFPKWKEHLLGSGLPLENEVARSLTKLGFSVWGEYKFQQPTSSGEPCDRSVDEHAVDLLSDRLLGSWSEVDLLVECKYNKPGSGWVFTPHRSDALIIGVTSVVDHLTTRSLADRTPLEDYQKPLVHCIRGELLHERGANDAAVGHGLDQLDYALPNLLADLLQDQSTTRNEEDLQISFVCPMLVTNAELFILRDDADMKRVRNAETLSDVVQRVDRLVVDREASRSLKSYRSSVFHQVLSDSKDAQQRFDVLDAERAEREGTPLYGWSDVEYRLFSMCDKSLVVSADALEDWVRGLKAAITRCARGVRRRARLRKTGTGILSRAQMVSLRE
jgi:hypothetical protein